MIDCDYGWLNAVLTLVGHVFLFDELCQSMAKQSSSKPSASNSVHPIRPLLVRDLGVLNFQVALDPFALLKVGIMSWRWRRWLLARCKRKGERKRATKAEKDSSQIHNTILPSTIILEDGKIMNVLASFADHIAIKITCYIEQFKCDG